VSPGQRLVVALGLLLGGALLCYLLPPRAGRAARLLALLATVGATALLGSDSELVFRGGPLERSLGDLVPGFPLALRADSAGLALSLVACAAAAVALLESRRLPIERSGLLLCLGGSCLCALGGNVLLLFIGLELGNVGALLLALGVTPLGRRAIVAFAVEHGAALGLLAAAIELRSSAGTADLLALPDGSVGLAVAAPWALAGAVRLLAGAALPGVPGDRRSPAWASVAVAPAGLAVLFRLHAAAGSSGLGAAVAAGLVVAGSAAAVAGSVEALRTHRRSTAAARGLCVAAAGPVIALVGVGSPAALNGAAAMGLALILVLAAAPAWGGGGDEGSGEVARWLRALSLAVAGGLPVGFGTTALLLGVGAGAAQGLPRSLVALPLGAAAALAAAAGAMAARAVLAAGAPMGTERGPRPDAVAALGASAVLAVLPGMGLSAIVDRIVPAPEGTAAVGLVAVRGPSGGWSGGYLILAGLIALLGVLSTALILGASRGEAEPVPPTPAPAAEPWAFPWRPALEKVDSAARRVDAGLVWVDSWLTRQPGLTMVVVVAVLCALFFRFR